jgi:pyranose oxidase
MPRDNITTDVLIVGSAAVGATFARLLAGAGLKILMVEAGKQLSDRPGEHLKNAFRYQQEPNLFSDTIFSQLEMYSVPKSYSLFPSKSNMRQNFENPEQKWWRNMPAASTAYAVGGMLTLWTASVPDPEPFERAPFIPEEDWTHMLGIAKRLLNVNTNVYDHSLLGKVIHDRLQQMGFPMDPLQQAAEKINSDDREAYFVRWTGADTILGPLLDEPNSSESRFTILSEHRAEKLCLTGDRVTSVLVRDLRTYTTFNIHAHIFIVAGGAFLTPRLLWQSSIRPYALGRYLNDNLESSCQIVVNSDILDAMRAIPGNPSRNHPIPISHTDPGPAFGFPPTPERPWHGQVHRLGRQFLYWPSVDVRKQVRLTWYGTVDISEDNRITFSEKYNDRFGMPQITIHFRYSRNDLIRAVRMWWDMVRTANAMGSIQGLPTISPPGSTLHLQGTYRMGDNTDEGKRTSVTDSFSKVWGFENLYLGGLGNIPTSMANNPTLTACALAVRAASHIRGISLRDLAHEVSVP